MWSKFKLHTMNECIQNVSCVYKGQAKAVKRQHLQLVPHMGYSEVFWGIIMVIQPLFSPNGVFLCYYFMCRFECKTTMRLKKIEKLIKRMMQKENIFHRISFSHPSSTIHQPLCLLINYILSINYIYLIYTIYLLIAIKYFYCSIHTLF